MFAFVKGDVEGFWFKQKRDGGGVTKYMNVSTKGDNLPQGTFITNVRLDGTGGDSFKVGSYVELLCQVNAWEYKGKVGIDITYRAAYSAPDAGPGGVGPF